MISIKHIASDAAWVVLEGSLEGCPQVTTRRSIHAAALADGTVSITSEVATLKAQVQKAYKHWQAVQKAIAQL